MTEEAQRIAIAESVGIHLHDGDHAPSDYVFISGLPDYLNDLNAMHEVENNIRNSWDTYLSCLIEIRWRDAQPSQHPADLSPTRATAAQRAEAYLRTIGKWTTNQNEL